MRFGSRLTSSFYSGAALSSLVPGVYPVSLNGRPYMLDDSKPFVQRTVPLLRQQADASASPGEASINPEDLWRRSVESWHHGAGQTSYDRADSDPFRFRSSKGVDVWTQHALSLLPGTGQELASANTNLQLAVAGTRLYALDGTALKFTTDVASAGAATWTAVTGMPGAAGTSIASDGFNVWTANAANGVYATNRGSGAAGDHCARRHGDRRVRQGPADGRLEELAVQHHFGCRGGVADCADDPAEHRFRVGRLRRGAHGALRGRLQRRQVADLSDGGEGGCDRSGCPGRCGPFA
jgi:hypothetical protein